MLPHVIASSAAFSDHQSRSFDAPRNRYEKVDWFGCLESTENHIGAAKLAWVNDDQVGVHLLNRVKRENNGSNQGMEPGTFGNKWGYRHVIDEGVVP
jgi:hypothetical protein